MRLVRQSCGDGLCMACCVAMITGEAIETVLREALLEEGYGGWFLSTAEAARYLLARGMLLGACFDISTPPKQDADFLVVKLPLTIPAILSVDVANPSGAPHAVVWDAETRMVFDPALENPRPLCEFNIIRWTPITTIDPPPVSQNLASSAPPPLG